MTRAEAREDDRLVERFTERADERRARVEAMTVDAERAAVLRRALGMEVR